MPDSHRIDWIVCPYCTVMHDATTNVSSDHGAPPVNGDCNVCGRCARVSIYDFSEKNGLRLPTNEEMDHFMADADTLRAIAAVRQTRWHIQRTKTPVN